ncbi:hypothetical protein KJ359_011623 [Pestalotiopsis sp. 9143b]|nr:hypothetical protein KJ359_011623 [Pestalotiopsis sp. 9143b]
MFSILKQIWWLAAVLVQSACAQDLIASLDYGAFQGAYSAQYNISYWQKIPFAAPPTGENRQVNGSEDCLYLGLYGRPWTAGQPLRPVVVVFYGGAFIQGSASFTLPPSAYPVLNVSDSSDMIFVYPNYRVNAFGFLPGREVAEDPRSDVNAGLLDQEAAIEWTRRYVSKFGGDPDEISIWGQSAGGGSVLAQVISRPERPRSFRRALASSPFWPKTYANEAPEAQARYDALANLTGCAGAAGGSLACLKAVGVDVVRNASYAMVSGDLYGPTSYPWGPIIDGQFLARPLSEVTASAGAVELAFSMYNTHEGENFVSSGVDYDAWAAGFLPGFSGDDLARLDALYPVNGSTESIAAYNDSYTRAGLVYRDSVLACPAYWTAGSAPGGGWLGEYTIAPAKHASDVIYWNTVNSIQQTDPLHYKGFAGAFASFFMAGDPNALKLTEANVTGVPSLETGREWVIDSAGFTSSNLTQFVERCAFWRDMAPKLPI